MDLDEEIERRTGKNLDSFFRGVGEAQFRRLEEKIFSSLVGRWKTQREAQSESVIISLGAGYLGPLPEDWEILWVRRDSDRWGRIFMDRPQWNSQLPSLEDFFSRFEEREVHYKKNCDWALTLPEGADLGGAGEWSLLESSSGDLKRGPGELGKKLPGTVVSLLPHQILPGVKLRKFLGVLEGLGVETLEYRDDWLTEEQIEQVRTRPGVFPP